MMSLSTPTDVNNNVSDTSSNIKRVDHEVPAIKETESSMDFKIGSPNQQTDDDVNGIGNDLVIKNETLYLYYGELSSEVSIYRRSTSELVDEPDTEDYCTCDDTSDDQYFTFHRKLTSEVDMFIDLLTEN